MKHIKNLTRNVGYAEIDGEEGPAVLIAMKYFAARGFECLTGINYLEKLAE